MMAAAAESGSGAGATSRTRTLSNSGSADGDPFANMPWNQTMPCASGMSLGGDIRSTLERLEDMQMRQRSPQQPNPELDKLIAQAFDRYPEWRMRMAVMTKSPWLRKKILSYLPNGVRMVGSSTLGNSHGWRSKLPDNFTDHNWPTVTHHPKFGQHLPGGTMKEHTQVLRAPADKLRVNPTLSHSEYYSFPRNNRFPGTTGNGEIDKNEVQKKGTPGPGAYHKSVPRGTAFLADGGETVVLGANHVCPWKSALGHQINPIEVDQTSLPSAPKYSFSKTRRAISETSLGHGRQHGGLVKSDEGCLSPGHVYEQYASMRPSAGRPLSLKRNGRSVPAHMRVRCVPVEPDAGVVSSGSVAEADVD